MNESMHIMSLALAFLMLPGLPVQAADPMPQRWNYVKGNLLADNGTEKLIALLKQSKECGCTHILLTESRMGWLSQEPPAAYAQRATQVRAAADELGLKLIPMVFHLGYGGRYLHIDGNLMAGLPVKEMPFIVKGSVAEPDPADGLPLANGGFEEADGQKATGWDGQKFPGRTTFIDTQVKHSGRQSLRISNLDTQTERGANVVALSQKLKVQPFHYYRFSLWGKWDGVYPHLLSVTSNKGGRSLDRTEAWFDKPGADGWALFETTFNTLDATEITISLTRVGAKGNVWIDDVKIVPAGLMQIVRREAAPLTVASEDGKTTYKEGEDFKPVYDPQINAKPFGGDLDIKHPAAQIELTPNSRIKDGQRPLVSFYHTMQINADQMVISIQEPRVLRVMEDDIRSVVRYWPSSGYFMNYDEIRIGGWEPNPGGESLTCGQLLARHVKQGYELIKKYDSKATVYTWSDMFSPYHNARPIQARGPYYLCNGCWDGSWEGLPKDAVILNWYAPSLASFKFFADRGHTQVMCGYYDEKATDRMKANIHQWMVVSSGNPGVLGFMYTTWKNNFTPMKEYFQLVDTYERWAAAVPPPKLER